MLGQRFGQLSPVGPAHLEPPSIPRRFLRLLAWCGIALVLLAEGIASANNLSTAAQSFPLALGVAGGLWITQHGLTQPFTLHRLGDWLLWCLAALPLLLELLLFAFNPKTAASAAPVLVGLSVLVGVTAHALRRTRRGAHRLGWRREGTMLAAEGLAACCACVLILLATTQRQAFLSSFGPLSTCIVVFLGMAQVLGRRRPPLVSVSSATATGADAGTSSAVVTEPGASPAGTTTAWPLTDQYRSALHWQLTRCRWIDGGMAAVVLALTTGMAIYLARSDDVILTMVMALVGLGCAALLLRALVRVERDVRAGHYLRNSGQLRVKGGVLILEDRSFMAMGAGMVACARLQSGTVCFSAISHYILEVLDAGGQVQFRAPGMPKRAPDLRTH